jgi:hypothetical protein
MQNSMLPPATTQVTLSCRLHGPSSTAFVSVTTFDDDDATQSVLTMSIDCGLEEALSRCIDMLTIELERAKHGIGPF